MAGDIDKRKTNGGVPAEQNANYFEQYGDAATSRPIQGELLKFVQGDWFAGRENREIPHGTKLLADMSTLEVGWQRWEDGRPGEARTGLVVEGFQPARRADLGDHDKTAWETDIKGVAKDPWQFTNLLVATDKDGGVFTLVTSSRGGLDAVGELCKAYGKHIRQHPDENPVIELDSSSYVHPDRSIGRVKTPILKIVSWVGKDGESKTSVEAPKPIPAAPATGQPRF
jgi:hypothetical protein